MAVRILAIAMLWCGQFAAVAWGAPLRFKIGFDIPLSGAMAVVGEDIRRGIDMGVAEFSSERLAFDVVYEDSRFDLKTAASSAHKLLEQDNVDLIVSLWDTSDVVAPIAEQRKTPHIAIRWNPHIAERFAYTLTVESTYKSYVDSQLKLMQAMGVRRAAILTQESEGWALAHDYMVSRAASFGIELVGGERYAAGTTDFRATLLRLVGRKPDMVVVNSNPPESDLILRQLRQLPFKTKTTGYFDLVEDRSLIEGAPFVAQFVGATWFTERFEKKYGETFKARAPQAYDIIKILALVLQQSPQQDKPSGSELISTILRSVHNIPGASGALNVNDTKNIESETVWKVYKGGKFEQIDEDAFRKAH